MPRSRHPRSPSSCCSRSTLQLLRAAGHRPARAELVSAGGSERADEGDAVRPTDLAAPDTVTTLEKGGVGLRSINEAIDTTTPGGPLIFHPFGASCQFDSDSIQERPRAGLVVAKGLTVREAASV